MSAENGVVNYDGLVGMVLQTGENGHTEVWLGMDLGATYTVENVEILRGNVAERINTGKKPSGTLKKEVNRIYLHRAQLQDALSTLFATHESMVAPKKEPASRKSAVWKARYDLLNDMPRKYLREYGERHLPEEIDNYILSDEGDRVALITKLTTILAGEKETEASEDTAEISA